MAPAHYTMKSIISQHCTVQYWGFIHSSHSLSSMLASLLQMNLAVNNWHPCIWNINLEPCAAVDSLSLSNPSPICHYKENMVRMKCEQRFWRFRKVLPSLIVASGRFRRSGFCNWRIGQLMKENIYIYIYSVICCRTRHTVFQSFGFYWNLSNKDYSLFLAHLYFQMWTFAVKKKFIKPDKTAYFLTLACFGLH